MLVAFGAGVEADVAAVLLHDALTDPEAEAGAFLALGGEEGLEEAIEDRGGDTGAVIGDGDGETGGAEVAGVFRADGGGAAEGDLDAAA